MSSMRSITFRRGWFQGWTVDVFTTGDGADPSSVLVQLAAPGDGRLSGLLTFLPDTPGAADVFPQVRLIFRDTGAPAIGAYERILAWIVDATREALGRRTDITPDHRAHWESIVAAADASRADFISQMLSGNLNRTVEDVDSDALLSFSAIKAAATD